MVKSVIDSIKQQLIKTKVYSKNKLIQEVADTSCGLCHQEEETMNHIMCSCSAIAQDLYKERHDCMLRLSISVCYENIGLMKTNPENHGLSNVNHNRSEKRTY